MAEQVDFLITSPEQQIRLSRGINAKKYRVRWVQIVGANFPTDSVFFISGDSTQDSTFGVATTSNYTANGSPRRLSVPITAATSTTQYHDTVIAIDNTKEGYKLDLTGNAVWNMRVSTNSTQSPSFTYIWVCLQSCS